MRDVRSHLHSLCFTVFRSPPQATAPLHLLSPPFICDRSPLPATVSSACDSFPSPSIAPVLCCCALQTATPALQRRSLPCTWDRSCPPAIAKAPLYFQLTPSAAMAPRPPTIAPLYLRERPSTCNSSPPPPVVTPLHLRLRQDTSQTSCDSLSHCRPSANALSTILWLPGRYRSSPPANTL